MDKARIKDTAVKFARQFEKSRDCDFDISKDFCPAEWYAVLMLTQIYYNVFINLITKEQAQEQQRVVFDTASKYYDVFDWQKADKEE